jgi:predicted PurR-regulated permease PerM
MQINANHGKIENAEISTQYSKVGTLMQQTSLFRPILILAAAAILLALMHLAASFLVPVLLAGFFAMLLTPVYRWLKRIHIPTGVALLLTMVFLVVIVVFLVLLIGNSMTTMAKDLEQYTDQLSQRQAEIESWLQSHVQSVDASEVASAVNPSSLTSILSGFLGAIGDILKNSVIILIVVVFVLAEGPFFIQRLRKSYGAEHFLPQNLASLAHMMISYFGLRAIVNLVTATFTGLMFWLLGIPNAGLWAVLTFFLSFIPYIGAFVAGIPPVILAYAHGGLEEAIIVVLLMVVINAISENIVAPLVMGRGLSISPTVVFLSFLFWMFILGGSGAFIAMPLTLGVILFMRNFEETRSLVEAVIVVAEPAQKPANARSKA